MATKNDRSQSEKILAHLMKGNKLSQAEAKRRWKILSPSKRISELRASGYDIIANRVRVKDKATGRFKSEVRYQLTGEYDSL